MYLKAVSVCNYVPESYGCMSCISKLWVYVMYLKAMGVCHVSQSYGCMS